MDRSRTRVLSALPWAVSQHVGRQLLAVVAFLIIARFIQPADLGLLGIATVWIAFLNVFTDLGFSAALVQRREVATGHISSAFYLNLAVGLLLTVIGIVLSRPVASMLHTPAAAPVMQWLSIGCLLNALATVPSALAQRELRFAALAARDVAAVAVGGVVGIVMAVGGWGVAALVAQTLVASAVATLLLWGIAGHRVSLRECGRAPLAELWTFGSRMTAFGVFKYLVRNVDAVLIGYSLGPAPLGSYLFAQRLVLQPIAGLEAGVGSFVFARASSFQHDRSRLASFYLATVALLNALLVAWALVVSIAAPGVLHLYFAGAWDESLSLLWLLAIVVVTHAPIAPMGHVMKAMGEPGWLLRWSVAITALTVGALWLGLRWELRGAVAALAAAHLCSLPYIWRSARRYLGVGMSDWIGAVGPAYGGATIVLLLFAATSPLVPQRPIALAACWVAVIGAALVVLLRQRTTVDLLLEERA